MFSNLNKPTFGTSTSTPAFGFGNTSTTNQTPFGQTQFFGKSNTGGFGQTAPLFGSTSQQNTGTLFSNTALPAFGGTTPQSGFGTGLFGQQQNVGVSSGTNGLFTSSSTSSFGQQNKTPSFGFGSSGSTLFGQQQGQNFQPSTSGAVFGASSGFGAAAQMGTNIKFNPATGTDTMQKSGVTHSINTKHHCITCMKEYEGKSLEELRWEDYQANRKGPQNSFGTTTAFGAPASTAPSLFGQTENKTAFGQTSTFGTPATSGFNITNQTTQPSLFGKPNTGFGATPTTNSFSFNSTSSAFGSTNIGKTFGNQPTQNVFGAPATTQATMGFGNNLFPNTTQNAGLFGKTTTQSVFSNQQPSFAFNQSATTQPSFFQNTKPNTGFGNFATSNLTTTPGFGQPTNLFSSQATQNPFNAMQKPAQPPFGQQNGFGLGTQPNTSSFFGGNKSLFGGNNTFFNAPNSGFMMNQQQQPSLNQSIGFDAQPNQDFHTHVEQIYDPFPHYNFLLDAIKGKTHNTTDPKALKEILDQAPMPVTSIEKNISKYRTLIKPRNTNLSYPGCKYALVDDVDKTASNNNLSFKTGKRLVLRKNVARPDRDMIEEYKRMVDSEDNSKNKSLFRNLQQLDNEKCDVLEQAKSPSPNSSFPSPTYNTGQSFHPASGDNFFFEETPVKDKFEKPKAKQILLNSSTQVDSDQSIDANPKISTSPLEKVLQSEEITSHAKSNKTVRFQDNELEPTSENNVSSPGVNLVDESDNNSESEDDTSTDDNVRIPTSSTCGVKLTHLEYYTKPPLTQLHKYQNEKGECIVKGFTVGRIGYGSIFFPDPMDVANLDLDEIVQFRFREITVYPDDDKKPPVGQGLNRRAQITLKHVWPRDRVTQEIIRDVRELSKTNFIDRLSLLAERQNATFVDYHPDTGSWLFSVNHFSKYKFSDSSDEECERLLRRSKNMFEANLEVFEGDTDIEFERMKLGAALMDTELDSATVYPIFPEPPQLFRKNSGKPLFIIKSSFFDEESISDDESSCDIGISLPLITSVNTSISSEREQLRSRDGVIKNYPLLFKSGDSVKSSSQFFINNYVDCACFKGRSFKVRWSQGYKFTTRNFAQIPSGNLPKRPEDSFINRINIMDVSAQFIGNDQFIWEEHLKVVFELTSFHIGQSSLPTCKINSSKDLLKRFYEVTEGLINSHKNKDLKYYRLVWDLCRILWGSSDVSDSEKLELFSSWLHSDLPSFDVDPETVNSKDAVLLKLFKLYLSNDVSSVSQFALENCFPALSLLMAQKQQAPIKHLLVQYGQWQNNGTLGVMDEHILRLYMLLGGTEVIRGSNVFRNLEWKQILAIYLWYMCPKNVKIEDVVAEYSKAFTIEGTANYPLTPHHDQISEMALDLQFRLLELYSNLSTDLCKILNPFGYTKHIGDYHLSWFLLLLFETINIGVPDGNLSETICFGFAAQLEAVGSWTWAIFVLLFIKNEETKLKAVTSVLERNIEITNTEKTKNCEMFLINKLKIPPEMIHSIISYMKSNEQSYPESYQHLALSKHLGKASHQAQLYIIPELIINHKYKDLYYLLKHFDDVKYDTGIALIMEFLQMHNDISALKNGNSNTKIQQMSLESDIISFSKNVKLFPKFTLKQSLTIAELSRHIKMLFDDFCSETLVDSIESELSIPDDHRFLEQCSTNVVDDCLQFW